MGSCLEDAAEVKRALRQQVWSLLESRGMLAFPFKAWGHIPNFVGSRQAARLLCSSKEFSDARVVKVNPDSPQREVRRRCIVEGKTLIMPTPRLKGGFIQIDPGSAADPDEASTIAGATRVGRPVSPESLPKIDLLVFGSVAVAPSGARIGKGEGYAEIEYAILRHYGKVSEHTPVFTTVHELQVVGNIPVEPFDVCLDSYFTPKMRVDARGPKNRPQDIIWGLLDRRKLEEIPLLRRLAAEAGLGG